MKNLERLEIGSDKNRVSEKEKAVIAECFRWSSSSVREIAEVGGISKSTIDETKRYAKLISDGVRKGEEEKKKESHVLRETQYVPNKDDYKEKDLPF